MKSLSQWRKPTRVATILHMQTSYDRISRLLARFNIKAIHIPTTTTPNSETSEGRPWP
jgi:hypothetical protein